VEQARQVGALLLACVSRGGAKQLRSATPLRGAAEAAAAGAREIPTLGQSLEAGEWLCDFPAGAGELLRTGPHTRIGGIADLVVRWVPSTLL